MLLKNWNDLPKKMQNDDVKPYYDELSRKSISLVFKRIIDVIFALLAFIILLPLFVIIAIVIKIDSKGPVFFRQVRIGANLKEFRIFKFRTMVDNAEKLGTQVTTKNDSRITRVGNFLRKTRLDELPQVINIIIGDMTIIGSRPEVKKYVDCYTDEMYATLLLPPGLSCKASIEYRDENKLLDASKDVDKTYIEEIMPVKASYNLEYLKGNIILQDIKLVFSTIACVFK